jgi:hypothetical protein
VHPAGAVGDPDAGGAAQGDEPGLFGDELLGLPGQLLEVRQERVGVVRVGERIAAADPDADALGDLPGDRIGAQGSSGGGS